MAAMVFPSNPIFYAQFNLRGGLRNTLIYGIGYFLLIGAAMWITAAYPTNTPREIFSGWLHGLLVLQLLALVIYGSLRVASTVRADMTSGVIESHRLMPLSPISAAAGYLMGAPAQAIAIALANFLLGCIALIFAGISFERWLVANFMIGAFALMIWTISANIAFSSRGGFAVVLCGVLVTAFSNGMLMTWLPGLAVLTCPLITRSVLNLAGAGGVYGYPYAVAFIGQFMIGGLCLLASANKYRSPDGIGLTTTLGLLLLLASVAISVVGIERVDDFTFAYMHGDANSQFTASVLVMLLVSLIPLSAAARAGVRSSADESTPRRGGGSLIATIFAVTAIIAVLFIAHSRVSDTASLRVALIESAGVVFAFSLTMGLLFQVVYRTGVRGWIIALPWLMLTAGLPMVADLVQRAIAGSDEMGMIATLSPIGALIKIWGSDPTDARNGIVFQLMLAVLPALLLLRIDSRRRRQRPPPLPSA